MRVVQRATRRRGHEVQRRARTRGESRGGVGEPVPTGDCSPRASDPEYARGSRRYVPACVSSSGSRSSPRSPARGWRWPIRRLVDVELDAVSSSPCADAAIAALDPARRDRAGTDVQVTPEARGHRARHRRARARGGVRSGAVRLRARAVDRAAERARDEGARVRGRRLRCRDVRRVQAAIRAARSADRREWRSGISVVEVESAVEISHTFRDLGAPSSVVEQFRLACASRARVLDCKTDRGRRPRRGLSRDRLARHGRSVIAATPKLRSSCRRAATTPPEFPRPTLT